MNHRTMESTTYAEEKLNIAAKKIAPVWPLENFVAVNPYMALIDSSFGEAAKLLCQTGGSEMTMSVSYYEEKFIAGEFTNADWKNTLQEAEINPISDLEDVFSKEKMRKQSLNFSEKRLPTLLSTASIMHGIDLERFSTNWISQWAAAYFDEGQAIWTQPHESNLFSCWKNEAAIDKTPELAFLELEGVRNEIKSLSDDPVEAVSHALKTINIPENGLDLYLHRLLYLLPGWAGYAARLDWDAKLYGKKSRVLIELLAVLVSWEYVVLKCFQSKKLNTIWEKAKKQYQNPALDSAISEHLHIMVLLQKAFEKSWQRKVINEFNEEGLDQKQNEAKQRSDVQAVFCIDVRSEVFRRHFESTHAGVETMGFAGFFAFPIEFTPIGYKTNLSQCPVLLTPQHRVSETAPDIETVSKNRGLNQSIKNAWYSFKMGAISCFSFVGPIGLAYLPKLLTDGFGLTRPVKMPEEQSLSKEVIRLKKPNTSDIPLESKVQTAFGALQAMSLKEGFARLIMIVGHASTTANNPHATGLDCGACAGRSGEVNARVATDVLNDPEVRAELQKEGIQIPQDTFFLSCKHDTTTDEISFFNADQIPESHHSDFSELQKLTMEAAKRARAERSYRMDDASQANILRRSKDWSQVRPEWGLAGCANFIVAPRDRTKNMNMKGRSFLHSYVWQQDESFQVLELIMTAPMIVASWISYQYYASTVDNLTYGSGNKTLHNVVGAVGVFEGNAGDLRSGLPIQSIHDGENLQHDPLRLNVFIEAPKEEINKIIDKHDMVRNLLDNHWLYLFLIGANGVISHQYTGNQKWKKLE